MAGQERDLPTTRARSCASSIRSNAATRCSTPDGEGGFVEAEWPEADFIVGNPPFLGGKLMRRRPRRRDGQTLFDQSMPAGCRLNGPRVLLV